MPEAGLAGKQEGNDRRRAARVRALQGAECGEAEKLDAPGSGSPSGGERRRIGQTGGLTDRLAASYTLHFARACAS